MSRKEKETEGQYRNSLLDDPEEWKTKVSGWNSLIIDPNARAKVQRSIDTPEDLPIVKLNPVWMPLYLEELRKKYPNPHKQFTLSARTFAVQNQQEEEPTRKQHQVLIVQAYVAWMKQFGALLGPKPI